MESGAGAASTEANGGADAAGGEPANGGDSGAGNATANGGSSVGGGSTGLGTNECRSSADCPPDMMTPSWVVWSCVAPHEAAPEAFVSGIAPKWCGELTCTVPAGPTATNLTCSSSDECAEPGEGASICANGRCAECTTAADCPDERPACARIGSMDASGYDACVECMADSDCGSALPRCVVARGLGGKCHECRTDDDCADGVCSSGACVAGCASDADCENPALPCSERHRCEPLACDASTSCPLHTECRTGRCQRSACNTDADCDAGVCVNGACHESFGGCRSQTRGS
jgi:hypothetical protein